MVELYKTKVQYPINPCDREMARILIFKKINFVMLPTIPFYEWTTNENYYFFLAPARFL